MTARISAVFLCTALTIVAADARQRSGPQESPSSGPDDPARFKASTLVVTLDAIVLNRKGERVRCLQASDFEVLEARQRQTVHSIERVGPHGCDEQKREARVSQENQPPEAAAVLGLSSPPPMTAIVFQELGPETRGLALRTVNAYIDEMRQSDEFIGIFAMDRAVHTIQKYTRDREKLLEGAKKAAMRPGCPIERSGGIASAADLPDGAITGGPLTCPSSPSVETLRGLGNIVEALANLPGRKSVVLFSEGFAVPMGSNAVDIYRKLISRANHAEITFHSIDAAGLRTSPPSAAARSRLSTYTGPRDLNSLSGALDPHEILSNDVTEPLGNLAIATGGRFIANTNDIESGLRRIAEDQTQYYRLTYHPANQKLDGKYRAISVRTTMPGSVVFSRRGYVASADPPEYAAQAHEMSALLMVESREVDESFAFQVDVEKGRHTLAVRAAVPAAALTFKPDPETGDLTAGLTMLVRTVDRRDLTLALTSRTFALRARPHETDRARHRQIELNAEVAWRKDVTALEVIAYDIAGRRVGVQRVERP